MSKMSDKKRPIQDFMQKHYTEQRLADLLCHARDGKLYYTSCCCFIGVQTANHALKGNYAAWYDPEETHRAENHPDANPHYRTAKNLAGAEEAESAFLRLGFDNESRRRILIPMVKAEMWRRAKLRKVSLAAEPESVEMEKV